MDICWFYHRFIPTNIFAFEQSQLDASSAKKRKIQVHADDTILSGVDVCDEVLSRCEVIQSFITNGFITGGKNKLLKKHPSKFAQFLFWSVGFMTSDLSVVLVQFALPRLLLPPHPRYHFPPSPILSDARTFSRITEMEADHE